MKDAYCSSIAGRSDCRNEVVTGVASSSGWLLLIICVRGSWRVKSQ
jgi:hypothetical protein